MLVIPGAKSYEPTPADKLWLLRAVQAEGAPRKAVAQVLVNGFAWNLAHGGKFATLASWVRAYSQPVNPRWAEGGDLFERAKASSNPKLREAATPVAAQRRQLASSRTVFDRPTHAAVERALTRGMVDAPRNATDFAASWLDASHKYKPLTNEVRGTNRLWTRDESWPGYSVLAGIGPGIAAAAVLLALLVGGGLLS